MNEETVEDVRVREVNVMQTRCINVEREGKSCQTGKKRRLNSNTTKGLERARKFNVMQRRFIKGVM